MGVKIAFLNGDVEEDIYMKQLEGIAMNGKKQLVCRLNNSLHGLNKSARIWYKKVDTNIQGLDFPRRKEDGCLYNKLLGDCVIYLALYVDDIILIINER